MHAEGAQLAAARPESDRRASRLLWRARRSGLSWVGAGLVSLLLLVALFGELLAPYPQDAGRVVHFEAQLQPPSAAHLMGTDDAGRDLFSRVLIGARTSLPSPVAARWWTAAISANAQYAPVMKSHAGMIWLTGGAVLGSHSAGPVISG